MSNILLYDTLILPYPNTATENVVCFQFIVKYYKCHHKHL